jgi:hypothetical protein
VELVFSDLLDRTEPIDFRVVHQDIDRPEGAVRLGEDAVRISGARDVSLDRQSLAARAHDVRNDLDDRAQGDGSGRSSKSAPAIAGTQSRG